MVPDGYICSHYQLEVCWLFHSSVRVILLLQSNPSFRGSGSWSDYCYYWVRVKVSLGLGFGFRVKV